MIQLTSNVDDASNVQNIHNTPKTSKYIQPINTKKTLSIKVEIFLEQRKLGSHHPAKFAKI